MEQKLVEEEVARRVEELVAKRVEEELEKRREEIEEEVKRRVEEAKSIMEKQMLEEMGRKRQAELEAQRLKEVQTQDMGFFLVPPAYTLSIPVPTNASLEVRYTHYFDDPNITCNETGKQCCCATCVQCLKMALMQWYFRYCICCWAAIQKLC